MHAHHASGVAEPERKIGCHRAPAPPRADVCVRSACGRDAETVSPVALFGILGGTTVAPAPPPVLRLAAHPVRLASRFAPEPPTEPPRTVRG